MTVKVAVCPATTFLLSGCAVMDGATGAAVTVRVAALLVMLPAASLTVTVNEAPLSETVVAGVANDAEVAPEIALPFFFHWYVRGAVPVAVTVKPAVCPAITLVLTGCDVMDGATGAAVTVRVAALLVTLPVLLLTVTVNEAPLSEVDVAGVVYDDEIPPEIAPPFFFHW